MNLKYPLYFFTFFPYLNPITTPWSLQPFALIFAFIYLFNKKIKRINLYIFIPLVVGIMSILIGVLSFNNFVNSIRSIANYVSFPLISWAIYESNPTSSFSKKFITTSFYIYITIGLIQQYVYHDFFIFLVPHQSSFEIISESGRGVSSLTPEPSYFGFILLLYFFIAIIMKNKKIFIISALSILLLSKSLSVIICLFISITAYIIFKKLKTFIAFSSFMILFGIITLLQLNKYESSIRSIKLVKSAFEIGVISTLENDESAYGRFYHIFYPIKLSANNYLLPYGYNGLPNGDTRILSGLSGAIYELGFISILLIITLTIVVFLKNNLSINEKIAVGIGMYLFIINANQFGMPIFCLIFSLLLFKYQNDKKHKSTIC